MKIMEWNIRHGGAEQRKERMLDVIGRVNADVLVLTEYQKKSEGLLLDDLHFLGYEHIMLPNEPNSQNGVMAASKVQGHVLSSAGAPAGLERRWLSISFPSLEIGLLCVHVPGSDGGIECKRRFWEAVVAHGRSQLGGKAMIIGDFNTGLKQDAQGSPFVLGEYMERLTGMGWSDLWRMQNPADQEFSWFSHVGNGFRLDHAFATKELADRVQEVHFDHGARVSGASDHSAIVVTMADTLMS